MMPLRLPTSSPVFLIAAVCTAQVLAQLGAFTFFALLPTFFQEWGLSHSQAGILNGIIFGAYALIVPFVVPLTDRIDPRRIYICAVVLTTFSHLGMSFIADGFWDGFVFRALAGIGCHFMAQWMDRSTTGFTQMGGEGAGWVGESACSNDQHVFQNIGDGTYFHSGLLAVRAAIAAGTNITFKIL